MATDRHLAVFVKAPRLGRVKTRLARDVGSLAAWSFYRNNTKRLRGRERADGASRIIPEHLQPESAGSIEDDITPEHDSVGKAPAALPPQEQEQDATEDERIQRQVNLCRM